MNIYEIILTIFSILAITQCILTSSEIRKIMYFISSALLIYIFAVQDICVGPDTAVYYNAFYFINKLDFHEIFQYGWEPGYLTINWLVGSCFDDARALIIFMAFFILIPILRFFDKESLWPELSLIIFVGSGMLLASMGIYRQWCAMAILTLSYKYIKERSLYKFLLVLLVAMSFHRTAICFLLAYFLHKIHINLKNVIFSMSVSLFIGLGGGHILSFLNKFARISEDGNFNGGISMLFLLWGCVFAILIVFRFKVPKKIEFYYKMIYIAAVLQPIAFSFSNWARIVIYFSIALTVLIPNVIVLLTDKVESYPYRIVMGLCCCILMYIWLSVISISEYVFMS